LRRLFNYFNKNLKPYLKFKLKKLILFFYTFILLLIAPGSINSAEILQINSPNTILIGDQNRNLSVNLFCVQVDDESSIKATELLKKNFPRGTKVKIKPYGKQGDNLLAKVYNLNNNIEMTELLNSKNLTSENCLN
tara:strand:+ start:117 stop:524 length:408 start_codon:yes stop_codon:yes gene_type:complete